MTAHGGDAGACGHASCIARLRGREAAGKAAYEFYWGQTYALVAGWDELPPADRDLWVRLVEVANDAWWGAWSAD